MLLELHDEKHKRTLYIELSHDGTYWNVNSGGIFKKNYTDKNDIVWPEPTVGSNANTNTAEVVDSSAKAAQGETVDRGGNSSQPISSADKVTNKGRELQTNNEKSAGSEQVKLSSKVEAASQEVDTHPTEAQKEAGNYKKGHVQVGTFDISIEQPEGSIRRGTDADGKQWESKMHNTYGYFRGTEGVDGDHIDVFLSTDIDGWNGRKVFVVDQYNPDGTFDEHKVMLGFNDMDEAKSDYLANYEKGWENGRRITVTAVNLEDFEKWIDSSHRKTKPFSEYSSVNKETVANAPAKKEAEKSYRAALDHEGDVEQEWEEKIQDYVAEHYPTQAVLSADSKSEQGLREKEAMSKDAVLKKMREEATEAADEARKASAAALAKLEEVEAGRKPRLQKAEFDEIEATAKEHGVDATWLSRYAEGMREKNSAAAVMALRDMKALYLREHTAEKKALMEREGISGLRANKRLFEPIEKAIKAKYGDVDVLVEEHRKQAEQEHNIMEAACKRAEEEERKRQERLDELAGLTDEEIDKRYAEALEKGDEAAAREMLDEAARRKGYGDATSDYQGVGAWSAPSDPGFATAEERRADVEVNGGDVNLDDIAHGYSPVQEEMYSHPERTGFGDETGIEAGRAINNALNALKEGKKDVKIKVYRAVPTSVKEGKLRNGDWVTPSRKYAEAHGNSRLEGKYRIIEDEVPASELWFDGNDIREWGYDNGKSYRYKNAKNNRKLNDLVTRDDKGNIIPPSKRFNSRKADERYQKADSKAQADKREAALRDAVVDRLREGGMEVSMDAEEGQRVLDEVNGKGETVRQQARLNALAKAATSIRNWLVGNKRGKTFTIELPLSTQRMIHKVMGRDFDSHNITANGIAHAKRNHGENGLKLNEKSIALRDEDFELMPYIMTAPDYVRKGTSDVTGRESIRFYKELGNGYVVVAEKEYKNSPDDMETITMWAEKSSSEATNARRNAPDTHVRNAILSTEDAAKIRKDAEMAIQNDKNIREQRVYHGSGADFDRFDHSHMGEGEGAQAYGWGTYVTEVEGIGRTYADTGFSHTEQRRKIERNNGSPLEKAVNDIIFQELYNIDVSNFEQRKNVIIEQIESYLSPFAIWFEGKKKVPAFYREEVEEKQAELEALRTLTEEQYNEERMKQGRMRHLYTVEIPDDTGENYLDWNGTVKQETLRKVAKAIDADNEKKDKLVSLLRASNLPDDWDSLARLNYAFGEGSTLSRTGDYLYDLLRLLCGSDKGASEFLSSLGFTGIKYPADFRRGGRKDGKQNYVIFNEADAKITDHVRFFRTANGEAYGYTIGGRIYIDPRIANSETPVHEYAHLWATALRKGNAEEWQNVVGLMRGTPVWDEVRRRYPELESDDDIADEVLATYSGRRGAARLREEMDAITSGNGSALEKAEAVSALERVRQALQKFWKATADMLHIHFTSAEEVADRVMKDLLDGMVPGKAETRNNEMEMFQKKHDVVEDMYRTAGSEGLEEVNERFNGDLQRYMEGDMDKNEMLRLGNPQGVMRQFLPDLPIVMRQRVLKKGSVKKHNVDVAALADMPEHLSIPIFVFQRSEDTIGVLTDMKDRDGKNVCVAIELKRQIQNGNEYLEVNDARSFHGREFKNIVEPIVNNKTLKWVDKEKGLAYLSSASQPVQQEIDKQVLDTAANIVRNFENPKLSGENVQEEDDMLRVGDTKRLCNGASITFRRKPTATCNAVKRWLADNGMEYSDHKARTGSMYMSFRADDAEFKIRNSDHTTSDFGGAAEYGRGENISVYGNRVDSVDIDLCNSELRAADVRLLVAEVSGLNKEDEEVRTAMLRDRAVPRDVEDRYPVLCGILGVENDREHRLKAGYAAYVNGVREEMLSRLYPFTASNGIVIGEDGSVSHPTWQTIWKSRRKEAELELAEAKSKIGREAAERAMSFDDWAKAQGESVTGYREGDGAYSDEELSWENDPVGKMLGRSRWSKRRQGEFAARERERMAARVQELADKLHLNNVEVVTDASMLEGKRKRAKGFYNKRSGRITIVIPNHASVADVEQTLLHEAVAHYGLRELFGERFDTFLGEVYDHADGDVRAAINALMARNGWDVDKATEEYLASLAEDTDFEGADKGPGFYGWWSFVKRAFLDLLHKIGFGEYYGPKLSDNELRYILWRSYENLKEPGRYRSILGEAEDISKQAELKVGEFAEREETSMEKASEEDLFRNGDNVDYEKAQARNLYEERVSSGMYQMQEALQDSMLGLKEAMDAVLRAEGQTLHIEDVAGYENAYLGENRLSSVNQAECEAFAPSSETQAFWGTSWRIDHGYVPFGTVINFSVKEPFKRFFISLMKADTKDLLLGAREHLAMENSLHWSLDVNFAVKC